LERWLYITIIFEICFKAILDKKRERGCLYSPRPPMTLKGASVCLYGYLVGLPLMGFDGLRAGLGAAFFALGVATPYPFPPLTLAGV
jgi:hypothetical protein